MFSHVSICNSWMSPFSNSTFMKSVPKSYTLPNVPFTQRFSLSLRINITCAPCLSTSSLLVGSSFSGNTLLIVPWKVNSGDLMAAMCSSLMASTVSRRIARVITNLPLSLKSGLHCRLSNAISCEVAWLLLTRLRSERKVESVWRYIFTNSIGTNPMSANTWALKK